VGHHGQFLGQKHTRAWFAREQHLPSDVVDRGSLTAWQSGGSPSALDRAREQVRHLLAAYQPRPLPDDVRSALHDITLHAARQFGADSLPPLPNGNG